jgi:uncharacterized protein (TIGR02147 family)
MTKRLAQAPKYSPLRVASKGVTVEIFDYSNYREFLADYYESKKSANPNFSHRLFARLAGLSSPSHLLMIIKGSRNLSLKTIPKFAEGLKLNQKEKRYFEILVHFNQTEDLSLKARCFTDMMQLKGTLKGLRALEKERFEFLSKWYVVAIYVLLDVVDFRPDPVWISRKLGRKISPTQAKEALENLEKIGMIVPDPVRGFSQSSGAITVADDTRSIAVFKYHQEMIKLASEALKFNNQDEREFNGATIAFPKEKLPELKERIRVFRKEINQLASSFRGADEIYQLNIQLFALSNGDEK